MRAVVNFVGGWKGSRTCLHAAAINQTLLKRGVPWRQPSLWLYGDNDIFYPLEHSRANFDAFLAAGGKGVWHDYKPPDRLDGHQIVLVPWLWAADMEAYLAGRGLPGAATSACTHKSALRLQDWVTPQITWEVLGEELSKPCHRLGSVNPSERNMFSNTGIAAAVLPLWQSSSASAAVASYIRPGEFFSYFR